MKNPLDFLSGYRSYLAAAGLMIAAVVKGIDGDWAGAADTALAALAVFGIKRATLPSKGDA